MATSTTRLGAVFFLVTLAGVMNMVPQGSLMFEGSIYGRGMSTTAAVNFLDPQKGRRS